ncbi:hypothetical protein JM47_01215 [Ureaplasma diversum]|uniref:Protein G-related albumin-binding (GA) module domain-containing protein n=1 Tax=Ureaplasma diversum TaxID=42094 RepID=A0A0C5RBH7_9BACT|nr:GA module-containing protein [Ureaplasma diversum]AJQ45241.1 hypothetical protein JM47_01215 [Ureaplasma diversum]
MSKLKTKKAVIWTVVGLLVASSIIGLTTGLVISKQNNKNNKDKELQTKQTNSKIAINELSSLSKEEKANFIEQLDKTKTINEIDTILTIAKKLDQDKKTANNQKLTEIQTKKQSILDAISLLKNLEQDQIKEYQNQAINTDSLIELDSILQTATNKDQEIKLQAFNDFIKVKIDANQYILNNLNKPIYIDAKNELESKIKDFDQRFEDESNKVANKYNEAKSILENAIFHASRDVKKVDTAQLDENKLEVKELKFQYHKDDKQIVKNLIVTITGKNLDKRFNNDPKAVLLIQNSKQNINYFKVDFPINIERKVLNNTNEQINFGANLDDRKNTKGDVEIDKLVLISDNEYHMIDLKNKSLKFNTDTTDKDVSIFDS